MIAKNLKKRFYTSIGLLFLILLMFHYKQISILSILVMGVLSILEFLNINKKIFKNKLFTLLASSSYIFFYFV